MTHPPEPPPGDPQYGPPGSGQPEYGQPAYGQPGAYPQQPGGVYAEPPNAPGAVAALVLGLIGVTFCGLCAPFAFFQGRKAEATAEASGGAYGGKGMATAGKILGIVGSVFLVLGVLLAVVFIIAAVLSSSGSYQ
jgi:hypothetical protein